MLDSTLTRSIAVGILMVCPHDDRAPLIQLNLDYKAMVLLRDSTCNAVNCTRLRLVQLIL